MRDNIILNFPGIIIFLVILTEKDMAAWTFSQDVQQFRWYSICSISRNAREKNIFYASADKLTSPYHGPFASWISSNWHMQWQ